MKSFWVYLTHPSGLKQRERKGKKNSVWIGEPNLGKTLAEFGPLHSINQLDLYLHQLPVLASSDRFLTKIQSEGGKHVGHSEKHSLTWFSSGVRGVAVFWKRHPALIKLPLYPLPAVNSTSNYSL